jgi:hypothetical protein
MVLIIGTVILYMLALALAFDMMDDLKSSFALAVVFTIPFHAVLDFLLAV